MERERKKIIQEIEKTNKFLESTTKTKQTTLNDIKAINTQVDNRKKLINTISKEISASDQKIAQNNKQLDSLGSNLNKLNTQYVQMQRYRYLRSLSNNKWSYLLSSENLNTFLLRWRYLEQFEDFNNRKKTEITDLKSTIAASSNEITKIKQEKGKLLIQEKQEAQTLEKEKVVKDKMLKEISAKENQLKIALQNKKSEREKLNAAIERIINEQLRIIREKASVKNTPDNENSTLEDVAVKLSKDFSQNKNKLPWPVANGFVSSKFGVQPHPSIKGVNIENNGIDISGKGDLVVNSVFEGEVVGVTKVPGSNHMVIVKHGNYYSVYSNLSDVLVSKGSKLTMHQNIGRVSSDETGIAEIHFELWKDKTKLNPESWLR